MHYLIQGFFFEPIIVSMLQRVRQLAKGDVATPEDDTLHTLNDQTAEMFSGIIGPSENLNSIDGQIADKYGVSTITNLLLTENDLKFDKKYNHRSDVIHYALLKNGDHWVGAYSGIQTSNGGVRCILTPLPADFLNPPF